MDLIGADRVGEHGGDRGTVGAAAPARPAALEQHLYGGEATLERLVAVKRDRQQPLLGTVARGERPHVVVR